MVTHDLNYSPAWPFLSPFGFLAPLFDECIHLAMCVFEGTSNAKPSKLCDFLHLIVASWRRVFAFPVPTAWVEIYGSLKPKSMNHRFETYD